MRRRFPDDQTTVEAQFAAQKLAFGPMMFQAARVLRDSGTLEFLRGRALLGATVEDVVENVDVSIYAARVLLEAGLAAEMLQLDGDRYVLTRTGYFVLRDPMTRVNLDFVHDVCYQPMFHFEHALREGRPVGLKEFGDWKTVYEGLAELPQHVRESWFAFDHYYSDGVFQKVLPKVFASGPARLLDIGANTGKFALSCCGHDPDVQVTMIDLPGQLAVALDNVQKAGFAARVSGQAVDMLDPEAPLPRGFDVIWMSQFLDCFSEEEVTSILSRAAAAMTDDARLFILETFWDRQNHDAARFSVINTSLYFAGVANGNSKMFHSERVHACVAAAGLVVEDENDELEFHTLLRCRRA